MAKKKKGKTAQNLKPENYIKQKARTLPIHECRINSDWEEHGMANITVARKHSNGNITLGMYLADIKCLGLKDTHYFFNISEHEYREILDGTEERMNTEPVSYLLAHNIIYAAIEFAEDYGFKPHKNFASVAQYILEEDTDDIELIDIECGKDGKPLYVRGPFDSEKQAEKIIEQLEHTAGRGNYYFINATDGDFFDDDVWNDEEDSDLDRIENDLTEQERKYSNLSIGEKLDLIEKLIQRIESLSQEEEEDIGYLINNCVNSLLDVDKVQEIYDDLVDKFLEFEITGELPDELLGIEPGSGINREEWEKLFLRIYGLSMEKPKSAGKKIKKLQKKMPKNPALYYLELIVTEAMEMPGSSVFKEKLNAYYNRYPHYPLIKILWAFINQAEDGNNQPDDLFKTGPEEFFPGRESLHNIEMFEYLQMLINTATAYNKLTLIEVTDWLIEEIEFPEEAYHILSEMIFFSKLNFLLSLKNAN